MAADEASVTALNPKAGLYAKLAEVMAEIETVPKNGRNEFQGYDYVTESDLIKAVRTKLTDRGVLLIPSVDSVEDRAAKTAKGKDTTITTVQVTFTFVDSETGQTHEAKWAGRGDDISDKGLYSAYTGALKYFLMKAFQVPTGDDPEARNQVDLGAQESVPASDMSTPDQYNAIVALFKSTGGQQSDLLKLLDDVGAPQLEGVAARVGAMTRNQAEQVIGVLEGLLEAEAAGAGVSG